MLRIHNTDSQGTDGYDSAANMGSEVYLGNAKVSNLDDILGSDEDVLGLQVPVQNVLLVDVLQAECNLNEPAVRKRLFYIQFP
jgi:hypothetical protein